MGARPLTDNASTSRFTRATIWLFGQVRPALHNVLWVIYIGLSAVITAAAMVVVKRCFGEPARVDFLLLGHFFVSAAMGALLSAFACGPPWLRATLKGY